MKKNKSDYFKELENFSTRCLSAADEFVKILNNNINRNSENDSMNHLQGLTEILRNEYFTPIEREDIFALATNLHNLYILLLRLNNCAVHNLFFSADLKTLSNLLYMSIQKIHHAVKSLYKFPKNDIYKTAFELKKLTNDALDYMQINSPNHNDDIFTLMKECMFHCSAFSDLIVYIYLKNT